MQRERGGHVGVAGCAVAAAAHRRSKMQRVRRELEREEGFADPASAGSRDRSARGPVGVTAVSLSFTDIGEFRFG